MAAFLTAGLICSASWPGSTARAWCRSIASEDVPTTHCVELEDAEIPDAKHLFWDRSCISYAFNSDFFDDFSRLTESEIREAVAASFRAWQEVTCEEGEPVGFFFEQLDKVTRTDEASYVPGEENEAVFLSLTGKQWEQNGYSEAALAVTSVWFVVSTGEIVDSDMEINQEQGPYDDCSEDCDRGAVDLQNTITHEVGHFIGLAHSDIPEATMYAAALPGETEKRTLDSDDMEGICAAYPPGSLPDVECEEGSTDGASSPEDGGTADCQCPPPPVISGSGDEEDEEESSASCACRSPGAGDPALPWWSLAWLGILAALALRRIRPH